MSSTWRAPALILAPLMLGLALWMWSPSARSDEAAPERSAAYAAASGGGAQRAPAGERRADPQGALDSSAVAEAMAASEAPLEGVVLDASGLPVEGCEVRAEGEAQALRTSTGPSGDFTLQVPTLAALRVWADCAAGASAPLSLVLEGPEHVSLQLAARRTLRVRVLGSDPAAPLEGASVVLERLGTQLAAASTDAQGEATFELSAFADRLRVVARGHAVRELALRSAPASEEAWVVQLTRTAALTLTVRDARGAPLPGASARLLSRDVAGGRAMIESVMDARGSFTWDTLPPGIYEVEAWHPVHGLGHSPLVAWDGSRAQSLEVRLGAGPAVAGVVLDAEGAAAPGATVLLQRQGGSAPQGAELSVSTDEDGRFHVAGLGAGAWALRAVREAQASATLQVRAGEAQLVLRLSEAGALEGRVVNGSGSGLSGVRVSAVDLEDARESRATATDEHGRFRLQGLVGRRFEVTARRTGSPATARRRVARGERVELRLQDEGSLHGRVRTHDGKAVQAVTVSLLLLGARNAEVRAGGEFWVHGLPPGEHLLEVSAVGYAAPALRSVEVREGEETELGEVLLEAGRSVTGQVADAQGQPVAGARVHAGTRMLGGAGGVVASEASLMGQTETVLTDAAGRFSFSGVPAQARWLMAEHPTVGRSAPLALGAGEHLLTLRSTGRIAGQVRMGDEPATGAMVSVAIHGQVDVQLVVTASDDGRYELPSVPPGEHLLAATTQSEGRPSVAALRRVKVEPGGTVTVDLAVPLGQGSLRVRHLEPLEPEAGAPRVVLYGPRTDTRPLGQDGAVTFSGLAPGSYRACLMLEPTQPRCAPVRISQGLEEVVL